ncbi:MAG: calcium-binding protein [Geminicoccaceae bacterium]
MSDHPSTANPIARIRRELASGRREDRAERQGSREATGNRLLAMGAPLSAAFVGFLVAARDGEARTAETDPASPTGPSYPQTDGQATTAGLAESSPSGSFFDFRGTVATAIPPTTAPAMDLGEEADPAVVPNPTGEYGTTATDIQPAYALNESNDGASAYAAPQASRESIEIQIGTTPLPDLGNSPVDARGAEENLGEIGDYVENPPGADRIVGTDANDTIIGRDTADEIDAGGGDDRVLAGGGDDLVFGGAGDDELSGELGNDRLEGGAGNDRLFGDGGDDHLLGGDGNDRLTGGFGNDRLEGGAGLDRLEGGSGDDILVMETFGDTAIETTEGPDRGGNDTVEIADGYAEDFASRFAALGGDGTVTFTMGSAAGKPLPGGVNSFAASLDPDIENIRIFGDDDHDIVAGRENSDIFAGDGDNTIWAGGGDDELYGMDGDDLLHGEDGDDILAGGDGYDMLFGDGGDDSFLFGLNDSAVDTVFDHEGVNRITIDGADVEKLATRIEGKDLVVSHDGADVVRIDSYLGNEQAFAGVDNGDGALTSFDSLPNAPGPTASTRILAEPAGADPASGLAEDAGQSSFSFDRTSASDDLLSAFLPGGTDGFSGESDMLADYTRNPVEHHERG